MSYKVVKGDTLSKIAQRFDTTYQELARINGISNPNNIQIGQVLRISNSSSPSSSYGTYKVVNGDTLGKIAQRFGTTYQEIARINGIPNPNIIQVGQILKIPGSSSSNSSFNSAQNSSSSFITYKIVKGDTLSKIAQRYGTTYQEIARINGIANPNKIQVGQIIRVPGSNVSNYHPPSVPTPAPKPASTFSNTNSNSTQIIGNINNSKILVALKNSPWRAKADSLAVAYYTLINNGYSVECAIGLMANLVAEGNYGIVE